MCDDPTNLSQENRDDLEKWVNQEARAFGFDNWIDAYHWNPDKKEAPGTEAPGASTENPFPVANCEERLSEPEALSSSADKLQQKMRPLVLHTINTEGDYERAKGWLRYEALRTMDIRRFTELVNRNIAGENFDEMVDQIIVEREGL